MRVRRRISCARSPRRKPNWPDRPRYPIIREAPALIFQKTTFRDFARREWEEVRFALDSPLEEAGFELSVPPERKAALDRVRIPGEVARESAMMSPG